MKTTTHPEAEDLIAYLENPKAEALSDICLHLAQCRECRNQADTLSNLEKLIKSNAVELSAYEGEKSNELKFAEEAYQIESYVDGEGEADFNKRISAMIEGEHQALKTALHYACHSSAMKRELEAEQSVTPSPTISINQQSSHLSRLAAWARSINKWFSPSTWIAIPATAFATALLVINLAPLSMLPGTVTLAQYQDNPVVQFQDNKQLPGIGFFSKSVNVIKPFNNMTISMPDANSIMLDWPKIEGAVSYTLQLQMIDNGQKVILAEKTTEKSRLSLSGIDSRTNQRYEWILSGKTSDEQTFYTTGGFVINHPGK